MLRGWGTKLRTSGDSCSHRADDDEMSLDPDYDEEGGEESEGGEDDPVIAVKDRTHYCMLEQDHVVMQVCSVHVRSLEDTKAPDSTIMPSGVATSGGSSLQAFEGWIA